MMKFALMKKPNEYTHPGYIYKKIHFLICPKLDFKEN